MSELLYVRINLDLAEEACEREKLMWVERLFLKDEDGVLIVEFLQEI